jgi:methylated-DNA-[protein]-cysteine S-methyltransferase
MIYYCTIGTRYGSCAVGCTPNGVAFATSPVKTAFDLERDLSEILSKFGATGKPESGVGYSSEVAETEPEVEPVARLLANFYEGEPETELMTYPIDYDIIRPTIFQRQVWDTVRKTLAWGAVASYQDIAAIIGKPGAARAVGNAMATCPLPGFIPCQRVVGSSGNHYVLGGYGSALELKRALLKAEGVEL